MLPLHVQLAILSALGLVSAKQAKRSSAIVSTRPRTYTHHAASSGERVFNKELADRDRLRVQSRYNPVATSVRQQNNLNAQAWNVNNGLDDLQQVLGGEAYDVNKRHKGHGSGSGSGSSGSSGSSGAAGASSGREPLTDDYDNIDERTSFPRLNRGL